MLQEFDLPPGSTIIGRSLDCHLTLEDPLVSRRHARIVVEESGARIEDMGSRNGVRINGAVIREPLLLRNGDRVRIGTQDFVFCCVDHAGRAHSRTTGQLRLCANCRLPYPRELLACPNCEATEQTDDDTLTGSGRAAAHVWTVQLMVESLERALRLSRIEDAERIAKRAIAQVEEIVGAGGVVDPEALAGLAAQATAMTLLSGNPAWARWVMTLYARTRRIPSSDVVAHMGKVAAVHPDLTRDALSDLLDQLKPGTNLEEVEALERLTELRRELGRSPWTPGTPVAAARSRQPQGESGPVPRDSGEKLTGGGGASAGESGVSSVAGVGAEDGGPSGSAAEGAGKRAPAGQLPSA